MIKIVAFRGGLGNQMFLYAFYLSLKQKYRFSIVLLEPTHCYYADNGFQLPDIFENVEKRKSFRFYRRIQKIYTEYVSKNLFVKLTESDVITEKNLTDYFIPPFLLYDGFWQSDKFFSSIATKMKTIYQFNADKLNLNTLQLTGTLLNENSISVHVRRNDYLQNTELGGICTIQYYKSAISYANSLFGDCTYYVFSDDIHWVKREFTFFTYKLVDWNTAQESWQDMFLMSRCKHNIIANSTFSWWGAWLNTNPAKLVIAPKKWFATLERNDVVPKTWVKL